MLLLAGFVQLQALSGCANIIPPAGGPRDSLPPKLVRASPPDSALNFHGREITLTFDEFVDLQDVSNNVILTPTLEPSPPINVRLNNIRILLKDNLEPNTTYTFHFGNAIKDINEGNVLRNFNYTFSTGAYLDSLQLSGRVVLAESGTVDTSLLVVLHKRLEDSAVQKYAPRYVTRVDRQGRFQFNNLPADTFAIYALEGGGIRRYLSPNQLFAFADAPVIPGRTKDSIVLHAYREVPKQGTGPGVGNTPGATGAKTVANDRRLKFSTNLNGVQQDLLNDLVFTFGTPLKSFDSSKILLGDSLFRPVPFTVTEDTTRKIVTVHVPWKQSTPYKLVLSKDFATDTLGHQLLKADTLTLVTRSERDYGSLRMRFRNLDTSQHPVLEFVQNGNVVRTAPLTGPVYTAALFVPGDYDLRLLHDTNGNGKWDPGHFYGRKRQPELVVPVGRKITVKAAWDNEVEVPL